MCTTPLVKRAEQDLALLDWRRETHCISSEEAIADFVRIRDHYCLLVARDDLPALQHMFNSWQSSFELGTPEGLEGYATEA